MEKKNNIIFWVLGIIIVFLVVANYQKQEDLTLNIHYYKNGIEVFPQKIFSFVDPPGENFDQISFDISATNQEVPISNMQIVNASPIEFFNSLPTTTQSLLSKEYKILWASSLMETVQFESVSPVNFWIKISGYDGFNKTTIYEEASRDISFESGLDSLIVDGLTIILGGEQEYSYIEIKNNGVIEVDESIGYLNLIATSIIIDSSSKIDGHAKSNYLGGNRAECTCYGGGCDCHDGHTGSVGQASTGESGGGAGTGGASCGGAGGSGGVGASQSGDETSRTDFSPGFGSGSAGSGGTDTNHYGSGQCAGFGERGGAGVRLFSQDIIITGTIDTSGGNGGLGGFGESDCTSSNCAGSGGGGGGGGSAGTIIIDGTNVNLNNAILDVRGGTGGGGGYGDSYYGGKSGGAGSAGAGGRIKIFYTDTFLNEGTSLSLGNGGTSYISQI